MIPNRPRYAARLNAFKLGLKNPTVPNLLARIAEVPGIDAADLNFPDHFEGIPPATLSRIMADDPRFGIKILLELVLLLSQRLRTTSSKLVRGSGEEI